MKYNYFDFEYYLRKAPYQQLKNSGSGATFIKHELGNIRNYAKFIPEFPGTKCEPLEFLYQCHESLCAIDAMLFEDLLNSSWRGVVWASWLAAVTPFPEPYMKKRLNGMIAGIKHNKWIVELALESLSNSDREGHFLLGEIYEFKKYLSIFLYEHIPLRKWPPDSCIQHKLSERKTILNLYKNKGTDAALKEVRESKINSSSQYNLDYKEWVSMQNMPNE